LGGRPIEAVLGEVKPFLSSYGRAIPLAQGSQLLVVENGGKMQTINELIASIPVPKVPPKPDPVPPPPKPVFATYSLGNLDPAAVIKTIQTLISSDHITVDPKTAVLSAYVPPEAQATIKAIIEKMTENAHGMNVLESVAYQASKTLPEDLKKQILAIAPNAVVLTSTDRVQVTASNADQALIRSGLIGLDITPVVESPNMKVFEIDPAMATIAETAMRAFLPKSQVGANAGAGALIVRGTEKDIQLATEIFEIWKKSQVNKSLQMRSIPLDRVADAKWLATVQKLVPTANAWLNPEGSELLMLATPADLVAVESSLQPLLALLPKPTARELKLYNLSKNQLARRALLAAELPAELASIKLVDGSNKDELFVWAQPDQHTKFKTFIDSLDQPASTPTPTSLKIYPLETAESTLVQTLLTAEFADAKITLDTEGKRLTVVATDSIQQKFAERLQAIEKELPKRQVMRLESYSVPGMPAAALSTALTPLTTKAKVSVDTIKDRLLITADESNHQEIKQLIDVLSAQVSPDKQKLVVVYPIQNATPTQIKTVLDQITTGTTNLADDKLKQLTVTGSIEMQAISKSTIDQMDKPRSSDGSPKEIRSFDTKKTYATYLLPLLQKLWPDVELAADSTTNRILATGTKQELDRIAESLDRLISSPDGSPQSVKTYPVAAGDMTSLSTILSQIAPQALISPDVASRTITVFATQEQHSRVEQSLEQISKTAQTTKQPQTYLVKPTQVIAVQTALITLFPTASVATVPTAGQIIVVATEEQQAKISAVIKGLETQGQSGEKSIRVFPMDADRIDATSMATTLGSMIPPQIQIEVNAKNQTITAIGTKDELDTVAKKIDEIQQQLPAPEPSTSVVYPLQFGNPVSAYTIISALLPRATVVYDITGKSVAVTAKPFEHERVRELMKTFDAPRADAAITKVYRLKQPNAYGLATILSAQFPTASIYGGRADGTLIATATPIQHERIGELVKEHDQGAMEIATKVFALQKAESLTLRAAIAASSERITATADTTTNSLIVTAPAEEMKRVEQIVREIDTADAAGKITKYYPLTTAEPLPMARALAESYPKTKFSSDSVNGGLYITGTPQEHEALSTLVEEINKHPGKTPSMRSFVMQYASPDVVSRAITGALGTRTTAGVSYNRDARTVFATGTPQELQSIEQMIQVMDNPGAKDSARRLEILSLQGVDGKSLQNAIESLFKDTSGAYVQYDNANEQLLVTGSATQITMVQEAIKKLAPPPRTLEIFNLSANDPFAMKTAIEALFQDEPMQTAPSISIDTNQQQLIVRATKDQFEGIKQLMQRMGENPNTAALGVNTGYSATPGLGPFPNNAARSDANRSGSRLRTVPVNRNPTQLLEDVQRLWPLIRPNPIQVVDPKKLIKPQTEADQGAVKPKPNAFLGKLISSQQIQDPKQDTDPKQPPVVVVAGDGQWTLASDDPEALAAMERLLATLLNPTVEPFASAGNFSVYILKHADAKQIKELIGELFRSTDRRSNASSSASDVLQRVKIVSDARTNALVIGGNKADRKIIEELLGVFDSKDLIDRLQQITPTIIPVVNASADTVSSLVKDVYKSQLSSGAGRSPLDIPDGVSTEVATILQQINAQTSGPLLTMSVNDASNMIVLRGPNELTNEVKAFIENIDKQTANAPSRRIQVLRLESSNSKNLEKALKILNSNK
jgi:type II secretory pathway component GspD/PulD (secretin)